MQKRIGRLLVGSFLFPFQTWLDLSQRKWTSDVAVGSPCCCCWNANLLLLLLLLIYHALIVLMNALVANAPRRNLLFPSFSFVRYLLYYSLLPILGGRHESLTTLFRASTPSPPLPPLLCTTRHRHVRLRRRTSTPSRCTWDSLHPTRPPRGRPVATCGAHAPTPRLSRRSRRVATVTSVIRLRGR